MRCTSSWTLTTPTCTARVISAGAMLQDVGFQLGVDTAFQPFAQASWSTAEATGQPEHLQNLGGEWPCVPFGTSDADPEHHGYASNADWRCVEVSSDCITLEIAFPDDHAVKSLRRSIRLSHTAPSIDVSLSVSVRRVCHLPIGLHPIFRLPEDAPVELSVPGRPSWAAIPEPFRPAGATLAPSDGFGLADAKGHPVEFPTQIAQLRAELVQAFDTAGRVDLRYPEEDTVVSLIWDEGDLPHCLFWLANPQELPGLGTFRGFGVEPVASWFDRGTQPIGPAGATADGGFGVELSPDRNWTTDYQIKAEAFGKQEKTDAPFPD